MLGLWTPHRKVVATVVYQPERKGFFLVYNPRWHGYSLPTRPLPPAIAPGDPMFRKVCEAEALQAFQEDSGSVPGDGAQAVWMDHVEIERPSGRTGRLTTYAYDIVAVDPCTPLPSGEFGSGCGLLSYQEILESAVVTWSTREILRKLLEDQHVGLGVVCRHGNTGREFLMIKNRYGEYFFLAARLRRHSTAAAAVVVELRGKYKFGGHVDLVEREEVVVVQQTTAHLGPRKYLFHLVVMRFGQLDLYMLEETLVRAGASFRWVPEAELRTLPADLSNTVAGVRDAVLTLDCPSPS